MRLIRAILLGNLALLITVVRLTAQPDSGQASHRLATQSDSLNMLIALCDSVWSADDSATVREMSVNGSYPVRALATVLLFRSDTATYGERFTKEHAIHDYRPRAEGKHNMTSQAIMLDEFKAIQTEHPDITDNRLRVLLMFAHTREANQWVDIRDQRVSMSRFFRSALLTDIFLSPAPGPTPCIWLNSPSHSKLTSLPDSANVLDS